MSKEETYLDMLGLPESKWRAMYARIKAREARGLREQSITSQRVALSAAELKRQRKAEKRKGNGA